MHQRKNRVRPGITHVRHLWHQDEWRWRTAEELGVGAQWLYDICSALPGEWLQLLRGAPALTAPRTGDDRPQPAQPAQPACPPAGPAERQ